MKVLQGRWLIRVLTTLCLSAGAVAVGPVSVASAQSQGTPAERAFSSAEGAFRAGDYLEAIRQFNLIRTKFPYTDFAKLADLRIADAYFAQEKYATSVEQYRAFSKLYPEHPKVLYAKWRVAEAFFEQMPKDWWVLPPGYERDLARAQDAERELRFFLRRNGSSQYAKEAKKRLRLVRRRLADHEFYVASFYLKQNNPRASALRLTRMLKKYSGLGLDAPALFLLARSYLELKDVDKALLALRDLVEYHPRTTHAAKARAYLKRHGLKLPR